jgi:hypothetical protein
VQPGDERHGKVGSVNNVVDMVDLMGRLEDRVPNRINGRMEYRDASIVVLDIVTSVT